MAGEHHYSVAMLLYGFWLPPCPQTSSEHSFSINVFAMVMALLHACLLNFVIIFHQQLNPCSCMWRMYCSQYNQLLAFGLGQLSIIKATIFLDVVQLIMDNTMALPMSESLYSI